MPSMLGKRKSRPTEQQHEDDDSAAAAARDLLRKHFEARFKPVSLPTPAARASESTGGLDSDSYDDEDEDDETVSDESSEGEWDGISDDGGDDSDTPQVEVVDHTSAEPVNTSTMTKRELKAYLSSRPPTHSASDQAQTPTPKPTKSPQEEDSAAFLANDLALQRLISESHILSAAGGNASHYLSTAAEANAAAHNKTFVAGRTRLKTTDLRIQALGAKQSVLSQAKMPMGMRKGINHAAVTREDKRRREAKENGIILERPQVKSRKVNGGGVKKRRSERGVDTPGVGKLRGAELRISARDVRSIEESGPGGSRGKGGGREKKSRGRRR